MTLSGRVSGVMLGLALAGAALHARQDLSRADSDTMERKLATISARAAQPAEALSPIFRTAFSDREVNAYLKYSGRLPEGLRDAHIDLPMNKRFDARAIVDLDAVRKARDYGFLANLLLQGTVEVRMSGTFEGVNGKGLLHMTSATLNGVAVASSIVQILLTHFSKTPDMPDGFQLDKPFDLTSRIRELQLRPGSITVTQ